MREDFEPAAGGKRRQLQNEDRCGLLVPYSTLALCSGKPPARRHAGRARHQASVFLNDGYHNAANSASRERLQPANAVLLRLQSVQCSRGYTQQ